MKKNILFFVLLFHHFGNAQIQIDTSNSIEYYVQNILLGSGVEVANIQHKGMIPGIGEFVANEEILGVRSGIILSTGNVFEAAGPNDVKNNSSQVMLPESRRLANQIRKGDKDLNKLTGRRAKDMTILEFDFIPLKNVLEFNYVFASEEYPEFVNSRYNDAFGFFLSGPGIKKRKNLAVLNDGNTPISINTVNQKKNQQYFRKNHRRIGPIKKLFKSKKTISGMNVLKDNIQFDGLTTVLKVRCDVIPYKIYHIKIAIGDAGDDIYDSAVFIEAGSFSSVKDTSGHYYEVLETISEENMNIDSIFGNKVVLKPQAEIEEVADFEFTNVYFDNDSYEIPDSAKTQLDLLSDYLKKHKDYTCVLYGYTDNVGSKKYNQKLSEKRAKSILDYLKLNGIDESRLVYNGQNFENPSGDNSTEKGRAENRRVEIILE